MALDGRTFEPTERGFLTALGDALDGHRRPRASSAIDAHERLRLLDAWLRQELVPGLPENVRVVIAGRDGPAAWRRDLGELLRVVRLGNLSDEAALELLERNGVARSTAARVAPLAHGHPLSLQLAAGALAERPTLAAEDAVVGSMVEELAGLYVDGLDRSPGAHSTPRRSCAARRCRCCRRCSPTRTPPTCSPACARCRSSSSAPRACVVHDTVRAATSALLRAADPARHRAHRSAAWTRLRAELRTAGGSDLWRYTADMLYLVENPIVRVRVLPERLRRAVIEPARDADDGEAIARDGDRTRSSRRGGAQAPETFRVVRDADGAVRGYSSLCLPQDVPRALLRGDPVARAVWLEHLRREPVPPGQRVLLNRLVARAPTRARDRHAVARHKRAYLELRPHLRRLYRRRARIPTRRSTALAPLGFVRLDVAIDDVAYLLNDFGPGSIDAWLGDVVGRELQAESRRRSSMPTNATARARRQAVDLSRLELDVLRHLRAARARR